MKYFKGLIFFFLVALSGCGALEPKFYPEKETITSTLFPSGSAEKSDPEFENKVEALLSGQTSATSNLTGTTSGNPGESNSFASSKKTLFLEKGKLLIINNLAGIDTKFIEELKEEIHKKNSAITDVESIAVASLPNLQTLRLMGARQRAKYVLIFNSFSNVYRYHNAMTIPTFIFLGIPYFFWETQTIKVFAKIEYSLIDIKENVILSNESVTAEAEGRAILPESGIVQFKMTNAAIAEGVARLSTKFLQRI